jgi:hypothetical protein
VRNFSSLFEGVIRWERVLSCMPATIAIGYGVVSDIASPSERGGYVGTVLLG